MQSGSSRRFFRLECVVLLALLGASGSLAAQYSPYGQALGTLSGQQTSCSSSDPNCQQQLRIKVTIRGAVLPQTNQERPGLPQGIVITGEPSRSERYDQSEWEPDASSAKRERTAEPSSSARLAYRVSANGREFDRQDASYLWGDALPEPSVYFCSIKSGACNS